MNQLFLLLLCSGLFASAQDFNMPLGAQTAKGYSYVNKPLPKDIKLFTLDGRQITLAINSPTLIQVWGTCCGGEPELWNEFVTLFEKYQPEGLSWISVNFENGQTIKGQRERLTEHFKTHEKPATFYMDGMGFLIDSLGVNGFPTYLLIDPKGTVIFKTSGYSQEGMRLLEKELIKQVGK